MQLVYSTEPVPNEITRSIFLAGPSPRTKDDPNWRPDAVKLLEEIGFDGTVFLPIYRDGPKDDETFNYDSQVQWEQDCMNASDVVAFWVPRTKDVPAFTTNIEFGLMAKTGRVAVGYPDDAIKMEYTQWWCDEEKIPSFRDLKELLSHIVTVMIPDPHLRKGGEINVPISIWTRPDFTEWYRHQTSVGNELVWARLLWSFRVGKNKDRTFVLSLHVHVKIAEEDGRLKSNEIVIIRPDISCLVAFHRGRKKTRVVLVREFRSPVNNPTSYVVELPGGSSSDNNKDMGQVMADEMREETNIVVDPKKVRPVGVRQIAATLSTHRAHVFAVELTDEEINRAEWAVGSVSGNHDDSEYTFLEVSSLGDIYRNESIDWSMIGMISTAIFGDAIK